MFRGTILALLGLLLACSTLPACGRTAYSITVEVTGMGRVISDPAGIDCSNTNPGPSHTESRSYRFRLGEFTTFTHQAADGWVLASSPDFTNFVADYELDTGKVYTGGDESVPGNRSQYVLEYVFEPLADGEEEEEEEEEVNFNLIVGSSNGGSVIIPGEGPFTYDAGEAVTLLAEEADADWQFDRWEGAVADQYSAATTVTMDADKTVTAHFTLIPPFEITSSAFSDGGAIPPQYSRWGGNVSPPLAWTGVPKGTVSFVLIMEDPVGWGSLCIHWIVFNIPSDTTSLAGGASLNLPAGAVQGTGSDEFGYYGCEPLPGQKNSYYFTLYALDTTLSLNQGATKQQVVDAMQGHIIDQAEIYGTYQD